MTEALIILALVVVAVSAWACLLFVIPGCFVSMLRYRLWERRDIIADELLAGVYKASEDQARLLIREIEGAIRVARELTMMNLMVMYRLTRHATMPLQRTLDLSRVTDERARERLTHHQARFRATLARHVLLHTWSGVFLLVFLAPAAVVVVLRGRFRNRRSPGGHDGRISFYKETKYQVRDEVPIEPGLGALEVKHGRHRKLSAYV